MKRVQLLRRREEECAQMIDICHQDMHFDGIFKFCLIVIFIFFRERSLREKPTIMKLYLKKKNLLEFEDEPANLVRSGAEQRG